MELDDRLEPPLEFQQVTGSAKGEADVRALA
nr:MAG TPA: hypothetical protein [Caudoviricetes sp.]